MRFKTTDDFFERTYVDFTREEVRVGIIKTNVNQAKKMLDQIKKEEEMKDGRKKVLQKSSFKKFW